MVFYQKKDGYCYNSDTLFLYDFISSFNPQNNLLDIGSGCGILGLLLKNKFNINLDQIDIQEENINLNKKNANINNLESNIYFNDFSKYKTSIKYDFIVSNPPYYESSIKSQNSHLAISRYNEYLNLEDLIKHSNTLLKPSGEFIFCYDARLFDKVVNVLTKYKLNICDIKFVHPTSEKKAKLVLIRSKKSSHSIMNVHPSLIATNGNINSIQAQKIFNEVKLDSIKI
ncbi:MAG: tRNA (adenine37-N(6))-methyltransferase TrmN6 (EC [uncultured Campylobacterales bacterium]|uniref:tRNA (Adenine37-N(6))-methyltransferase TrmN6 (EC) n=1 Tax=uncultured Campylobacterales bacterium TaxID=352960 RepID=A0A6S6SNJ0_9BACT|nr:MAG: tRNA (adenine37-N(6))-methyltransferase TrmN6 (EC [uncultured Campylobacterales bacterium]